jgi:hypothetical protein
MSKIQNVEYLSKEVVLSRPYPFGEKKKAKVRGVEKEVSVVTAHELTGADDEALSQQENLNIYHEISASCGLTIEEARQLSRADAQLIQVVLADFLYDSGEIKLLD